MREDVKNLIDKLETEHRLDREEYYVLITHRDEEAAEYLFNKSLKMREKYYGRDVYIRGLIEFTNYCKNDCLYCGIRCSNRKLDRYRLTKEQILSCCEQGYKLGFRTFVMQGGEDPYFTDERLTDIISEIKERYPDCAVTLSIGERSKESYQKLFDAGADRYLLREETVNGELYGKLHPSNMSLKNRLECLNNLKEIGFQVGCGFMVEPPYQTTDTLIDDLLFVQDFKPHMIGVGPYIPHKDTPFADKKTGSAELTLFILGILRLALPYVLLPATTALGTAEASGREKGMLAGANVVMPNLSPLDVREKYLLYNNKIATGDEAAESLANLKMHMKAIGFNVVVDRGDSKLNSL